MSQRNLLQHISLHKWFQYVYEKTATTGHDQERTQRRKGNSKGYISNVSLNKILENVFIVKSYRKLCILAL